MWIRAPDNHLSLLPKWDLTLHRNQGGSNSQQVIDSQSCGLGPRLNQRLTTHNEAETPQCADILHFGYIKH